MSIIAKKANPAEIDTPTTGKVSLYVDCNDGKIKIKDDSGCVKTLSYMGDDCCIYNNYVDVLVVGSGGGGGYNYGGGGGGGGVIELCNYLLNNNCIDIVVGGRVCPGQNGNLSCFGTLMACGGGHGGMCCADGGSGGSGGGGGGITNQSVGGDSVSFQGHSGGQGGGDNQGYAGAGGGGGGGGAGNKGYRCVGGAGGWGWRSCISGQYCYYAGGGGGDGGIPGCGGCGGGGNGGNYTCGLNATYYGGGGGGVSYYYSCCIGGCSYQGIVIVRYKSDGSMGIKCATGGTITCCNGYTIHTFTDTSTAQVFCVTCSTPFYPVV